MPHNENTDLLLFAEEPAEGRLDALLLLGGGGGGHRGGRTHVPRQARHGVLV